MHIAIIGNGVSGVTAARWIRKLSDHKITIISAETEHFFSRTALMYIYMGHMRYQDTKPYEDGFWAKNRINLVFDRVTTIDFDEQSLIMKTQDIKYDKLILAVGSTPNKWGWPGQDLDGVRGLYSYQDLEYLEQRSEKLEKAVIVGGGLIGIELAEMLKSRGKEVCMLVREKSYWSNVLPPEESEMVNKHIKEHHIDLRLNTELTEINGEQKVNSVHTKSGEKIDCQFVGLTAGVRPNIAWLKDTPLETGKGILVNNRLETNIANVYAIGDCAQLSSPQNGRRAVEAIWYTGRMMGETVAYNICGQAHEYNPGLWFNSAKFLDIEYQVYGYVTTKAESGINSLYWQHDTENKSIRIVYNDANEVVGFNLMGVRFRHEVCEKWILQKTSTQEVVNNLMLANFDPEFYRSHIREITRVFAEQSGLSFNTQAKRSLDKVLAFLRR